MAKKRSGWLIILILAAMVTVYVFRGGSPSITLDFGETAFTASVADFDNTVAYDQISSLALIDTQDPGEPEDGGEVRGYRYGVWRSETLGRYIQCTTEQAKKCILLELKNGELFLLSIESSSSTTELYTMMTGLLNSKGVLVQQQESA